MVNPALTLIDVHNFAKTFNFDIVVRKGEAWIENVVKVEDMPKQEVEIYERR